MAPPDPCKEVKSVKGKKRLNYKLLLMALPFLTLVVMFHYLPLVGWLYAFYDYIPGIPLFECEFVGLKFFRLLFTDPSTVRVMKNTLIFAGLSILLSPLPMLFAIALNEIGSSRMRRIIQTFTTLPHFISMVIVFSLAFAIFSSDGLLNALLRLLGADINPATAYNVMGDGDAVYWFQTALGLWKGLGWNSIVYLAAIAGVDQTLYDAAMVDGAGRLRCAIHVTLPAMVETYFVLLILSIGNFLNTGFEQYFLFKNPMTGPNIEVLDLYVYRIGLANADYSYGIAIGIMKFIVSTVLLCFANGFAKKVRGSSVF